MTDAFLDHKKEQNNKGVMAAYEAYRRNEPGSRDRLLMEVTEFGRRKFRHLEHSYKETAETADDWAQDVTIKVWQSVIQSEFNGTPVEFLRYLYGVIRNHRNDKYGHLNSVRETQVSFFHEFEDEGSEETFTEENPLIHEEHEPFTIQIPASLQGLDRHICQFIMDGCSYAAIARMFEMTEDAVKKRVERLKKQQRIEREQKEKAERQNADENTRAARRDHITDGIRRNKEDRERRKPIAAD